MTEREAIANLASIVAVVASRSWHALGTDLVGNLTKACREIESAMADPEPGGGIRTPQRETC